MDQIALRLFIIGYSIAVQILRYCVVPIIHLSGRHRTLGARQRGTVPPGPVLADGDTTVWLHAASLGESKLLCRFLDILRAVHPKDRYVVTAATVSGVGVLEERRGPDVCAVGLLPYDTVGLMQRFLRRFRVSRVWIMETELWPAMLWSCLRAGVPVGVANGRIEERSYRWYRRFRGLIGPLVRNFDAVLAQTEEYARRFQGVGVLSSRIRVTGNLKALVSIRRPDAALRERLRARLGVGADERLVTAGCIHPGEGRIIAAAMARIRGVVPGCRCIVVPRHIEKSELIRQELGDALLLTAPATTEPWQTCLLAKYGVLDDCYLIADVAVIGGTFVPVGGHNPWDAARYGVPVVFGPDVHTQQESVDRLVAGGAGFTAADEQVLAESIVALLGPARRAFEDSRDRLARSIAATQPDIAAMIP
jgi:3-deoxy-D-manno-octulosonic-acid transferase